MVDGGRPNVGRKDLTLSGISWGILLWVVGAVILSNSNPDAPGGDFAVFF
jgi:hypothetical protein